MSWLMYQVKYEFQDDDWIRSVMKNSNQRIRMKFDKNDYSCIISSVYPWCNNIERLELWEELEEIWCDNAPWVIGGDFNVILHEG